jgi:iron uptake system component EfeO
MSFFRTLVATTIAGTALLTACGGDDDQGDAGGGVEVAVVGTDSACNPATSEVAAGKTTFVFTNQAAVVNELYVYEDKKVIKEVENVITGATKKLTVTLEAGKSYTLTCKPGQSGAGFSAAVAVN